MCARMPHVRCAAYPAVVVNGTQLVYGAKRDARFFAAGFVYSGAAGSGAAALTRFEQSRFEQMLTAARTAGATSIRWNVFLKGLDFTFGPDGLVAGVKQGGLDALVMALELARRHGLLLQLVLATSHFLRCGWGGCDAVLQGVQNLERVERNLRMLSTPPGLEAYLSNVLDPLLEAVGRHDALLGFLIINEGYFVVRTEDSLFSYITDRTMSLKALQRFVNRVAGRIRGRLPEAILSASLKARACGGAPDADGVVLGGSCKGREPPLAWYEDAALVEAGGDRMGTLSMHQLQFYPQNAFGPSSSPFRYSRGDFCRMHRIDCTKPFLVGEVRAATWRSRARAIYILTHRPIT